MPKITELNAITSVANNDLLMVVHDPGGLPSTNKITVNNFVQTISSYVGGGGGGNANTSGIDYYTYINTANTYTATINDTVIFCNPNIVGSDINVILPIDIPTGKIYSIKNVDNSAGGLKVRVITDQPDFNYVENPFLGGFQHYFDITVTNDMQEWIFDGSRYRHTGSLTSAPIFAASQDTFHQVVLQNSSASNNASGDWVAYNDQGNYEAGTGPFIDMGINSSVYNDTTYGNIWQPNDGYLYNQGGNLIIAAQTEDTEIKFAVGNTNAEDVKFTITGNKLIVNNNVFTTKEYLDWYGKNQVEFSATSGGDGGGEDEAWVWMYQNPGYAEVGQYVQNNISWSEVVHRNSGAIQTYGQNSSTSWDYTTRGISNGLAIKPITSWVNELSIVPTGDYDIHLFESGSNGAITLGNYGQTQFRVYGPGGANNGGGEYGNDIRAELATGSSFIITTNDTSSHTWEFAANGNITIPEGGDILNSDGYSLIKSLPQNQQSSFANYTLQLSDAGKHILKDEGEGYGVEVPTNANVAFPIGSVITIVSGNGWTYIYPVDSGTTEVWGAGFNQTSTSFYIPNNSMATLLKIGTDKWMLSGAGLAID